MKMTPLAKVLIFLVVIGMAIGGWRYWQQQHGGVMPFAGVLSGKGSGGSWGSGGRGGASQQGGADFTMWYERSAKDWIEPAAEEFNAKYAGQYHVSLEYKASREGKTAILFRGGDPVLWNPGDVYWVDKLKADASNPRVQGKTGARPGNSETILTTRLVLVMWNDRAKVFAAAMQKPAYRKHTWRLLADIATKGWRAVGGDPSWGKLKLAQSNAVESNSAQMVIMLMYQEYLAGHPNARVNDPGFVKMMRAVENTVPQFTDTTSRCLDQLVSAGQGQMDAAVVYESNIIKYLRKGTADLSVIYPDPTISAEFPATILDASWVNGPKKEGAQKFLEYLLSSEAQSHALETAGLRPVLPELQLATRNALEDNVLKTAGINSDPSATQERLSQTDIDSLLYLWASIYGAKR